MPVLALVSYVLVTDLKYLYLYLTLRYLESYLYSQLVYLKHLCEVDSNM